MTDVIDKISANFDIHQFLKNVVDMVYQRDVLAEDFVDYAHLGVIRLLELFVIKNPAILNRRDREKLLHYFLNE